jgi:hypothetical protein
MSSCQDRENVVMVKRTLPEVRTVIEFDRLAKQHLADAYLELVPTPKRLVRTTIKNKSKISPTLQRQGRRYNSSEFSVSHPHSFTEKSILPIGEIINTQLASDDSPISYEISIQKRENK